MACPPALIAHRRNAQRFPGPGQTDSGAVFPQQRCERTPSPADVPDLSLRVSRQQSSNRGSDSCAGLWEPSSPARSQSSGPEMRSPSVQRKASNPTVGQQTAPLALSASAFHAAAAAGHPSCLRDIGVWSGGRPLSKAQGTTVNGGSPYSRFAPPLLPGRQLYSYLRGPGPTGAAFWFHVDTSLASWVLTGEKSKFLFQATPFASSLALPCLDSGAEQKVLSEHAHEGRVWTSPGSGPRVVRWVSDETKPHLYEP